MQATDLFMGLLKSKSAAIPEPFLRKADVAASGKTSFSTEFAKALDRTTQPNHSAHVNQAAKSERPEAAVAVKAPEQKDSSSDVSEQKSGNEVKSREMTGNGKHAKAKAESSKAEKPTEKSRKGATDNTAKADAANQDQAAVDAKQTDETSELNAKLQALTERLERKLAGDEKADDSDALDELIVSLLAFFLSEAQQQDGVQVEGGDSQISMTLNIDPESKLGKLLTLLMSDEGAVSGEDLKDVNVLLKLTDEKGLLIPISELMQAQPGNDAKDVKGITLNLSGSDADSLKINLQFSAESLKSAKLVDLSESGLNESDLIVNVSLDTLVQAKGQSDMKALIEELQKGTDDPKIDRLLDALGMSRKDLAQVLSKESSPETRISVSIPVSESTEELENAPMVTTTDGDFKSSDQYLKSLELQTLMKESMDAKSERKDLLARIQKLTEGHEGRNDGLLKFLVAKVAGLIDTSSMMDLTDGQSDKSADKWTTDLFKQPETVVKQDSNTPANNVSDRVEFLGRPAREVSDFSQILQKQSNPESARSPQDVSANVMKQLIQRVSYNFINGSQGEVRVLLRPASLGTIDIKVKVDQDVVIAKITAESHAVKAIIESNLGQLKSSLQEQGIHVGKFEVNVDSGSQQNAQNGAHDRSNDAYSSGYSTHEDSGELPTVEIPELMEGDFSYTRDGESTSASSRMSYLA